MDNGEGKFKVKIKMDKNLTISVVIPAYNEEENIGRLLDALQRQTRIPDEVIVVDDGSNDGTVEIVSTYSSGVTLIEGPHEGVNAARHKGTLKARSDIVVQTDADCIPPRDWIEKIGSCFGTDRELIGLTGNVYDYKGRIFEGITARVANRIFPGMGSITAYRRDAYLKTSGYNSAIPVHFGGDVEFWRRLNKEGKCVHDTSIVARHNSGYKWKAVGIAIVISGAILVAGMVVGY